MRRTTARHGLRALATERTTILLTLVGGTALTFTTDGSSVPAVLRIALAYVTAFVAAVVSPFLPPAGALSEDGSSANDLMAAARATLARVEGKNSPEVLAAIERALSDVRPFGPTPLLARLLARRAFLALKIQPSTSAAHEFYNDAIDVARRADDPEALAYVLVQSQWPFYMEGRADEQRARLLEALTHMERTGVTSSLYTCYYWLAGNAAHAGDTSNMVEYRRRAHAAAQAHGSVNDQIMAALGLVRSAFLVGDYGEAVRLSDEAATLAQRAQHDELLARAEQFSGEALFELGEMRASRAHLERSLSLLDPETMGLDAYPETAWKLARTCVALDDFDAARRYVDLSRTNCDPTDRFTQAAIATVDASLLERDGDQDAASAAYARAVGLAEEGGFAGLAAQIRRLTAEFLIRGDRIAEAKELLVVARSFYVDPLLGHQRDRIDGLIRRCEAGTDEPAQVMTTAWLSSLCALWNASERRASLADAGTIGFAIDDRGPALVNFDGTGCARLAPTTERATFVVRASARDWRAFVAGEFSAQHGVLARRLRLSGSVARALEFVGGCNDLAAVARSIAHDGAEAPARTG